MKLYEKLFRYFNDPTEADDVFYARSEAKFTYGQAGEVIRALSSYFDEQNVGVGDVVAIEAEKEFEVYCCCVACMINGITYVPFSKAQNFTRIRQSFFDISTALIITVTDEAHRFFAGISIPEMSLSAIEPSSQALYPREISETQVAYIMFSSGTTGAPKAIPVTRRNLESYIDSIESQYTIDSNSGFSQIAELTFDLSIHDIYLCISNKGFLCPIKSRESILGYRFVNELGISYWMSVPSTASYMFQMIPNVDSMPSLKCTFFLGEALSTDVAKKWIKLTPNGLTVNTYGPTECTVAASHFDIDPADPLLDTEKLVPIGRAFKNSILYSKDNAKSELLLGGEQLFPGYIGEARNTNASKFVHVDSERMYRTGDLVDEKNGCFFFKGRIDFQIKVRGYRIELEELEAILLKQLVGDFCVVPMDEIETGNYEALAVLYEGEIDNENVKDVIAEHFPSYLPIKQLVKVDVVPRNINGKLDRKDAIKRVAGC